MRVRLPTLPQGTLLHRYESNYGFGEPAGVSGPDDDPVAFHPFPAAVRARNLALCVRRGLPIDPLRLARACRAVLLQPEIHLLANHWLEDGFGLACGGCAASGPEADLWWKVGSSIVTRELQEQFLPDGGHFERSASYHLWLTSALLVTLHVAQAAGRCVPAEWRLVAARALGWIEDTRAPDGTFPLFNDASLDACVSADVIIELGQALGLDAQPRSKVLVDGNARAVVLPDTGWCLIHQPGATLAIDAGPDGAAYQPGHVHADSLTFELWIGGDRMVVDYGVSSYVDNKERRTTRATRSHNTVELDGYDSSEVWGAFRVGRRAVGRLVEVKLERGEVVVICEHDGYHWIHPKATHRRELRLSRCAVEIDDGFGPHVGVSTLRCDREALCQHRGTVQSKGASARETKGLWYPRMGASREAVVYRMRAFGRQLGWRLRWSDG